MTRRHRLVQIMLATLAFPAAVGLLLLGLTATVTGSVP
jgi:hypothetical protein